jgi:hypothetical protein
MYSLWLLVLCDLRNERLSDSNEVINYKVKKATWKQAVPSQFFASNRVLGCLLCSVIG